MTEGIMAINPGSCIKEFVEEAEPIFRKCLFCPSIAPADLPTSKMVHGRGRRPGWYSNALLYTGTGKLARFYLCPEHRSRASEAWDWARNEVQKE